MPSGQFGTLPRPFSVRRDSTSCAAAPGDRGGGGGEDGGGSGGTTTPIAGPAATPPVLPPSPLTRSDLDAALSRSHPTICSISARAPPLPGWASTARLHGSEWIGSALGRTFRWSSSPQKGDGSPSSMMHELWLLRSGTLSLNSEYTAACHPFASERACPVFIALFDRHRSTFRAVGSVYTTPALPSSTATLEWIAWLWPSFRMLVARKLPTTKLSRVCHSPPGASRKLRSATTETGHCFITHSAVATSYRMLLGTVFRRCSAFSVMIAAMPHPKQDRAYIGSLAPLSEIRNTSTSRVWPSAAPRVAHPTM
mmetsp:Transcript_18278/g.47779  ORF Transcript_18278/g.47779 Transcript_18278/m.47779 type:complete len:311 (+) Transcript_18278:264-1196(+)